MFLASIDLLSPPITLYYLDRTKHFQIVSGILALLTYCTIFSFSVYFFLDFFNKKNPTSYFFNKYIDDVGIFPFNTSSMFHYISLDIEEFDFSLITVIGVPVVISEYTAGYPLKDKKHWLYGKCDMSDVKGLEFLVNDNLTKFLSSACVKKLWSVDDQRYYDAGEEQFQYPYLDKGASIADHSNYGIFVEKCRDDIPGINNNCKSKSEIESYYIRQALELNIVDHEIDVGNYTTPSIKNMYKVNNGMFTGSYTTNHLNFNPALIRTHSGIVFEAIKEETSYVFDQNEKITTVEENTNIIGAFYFWMQNRLQMYERTYIRIQDVLANVGGVSKIIMTIAIIINSFFHKFGVLEDTRKLCNPFFNSGIDVKKPVGVPPLNLTPSTIHPTTLTKDSMNRSKFSKKTNVKTDTSVDILFSSQIPFKDGDSGWRRKLSFSDYIKKELCVCFFRRKKNAYIYHKIDKMRMKYLNEETLCKLYFFLENSRMRRNASLSAGSRVDDRSIASRVQDSKIYISKEIS